MIPAVSGGPHLFPTTSTLSSTLTLDLSYANSVLQALYFCGPFRDLVVQYPDASCPDTSLMPPVALPPPPPVSPQPQTRPKTSRKQSVSENAPNSLASCSSPSPGAASTSFPMPASPPTLLSALRSLYIYISKNPADKGTVAPRAFIDKLKELNELFRSTMHQDAHEFLNYLLNQIVEEMDEDRKKTQNGSPQVGLNGHAVGNGIEHMNGSAAMTPSREDRECSSSSSIGAGILTFHSVQFGRFAINHSRRSTLLDGILGSVSLRTELDARPPPVRRYAHKRDEVPNV